MDTFVAVLAAVVVVLVGAKLVQRRRRDEIRSIHHYHDRLDTLHVEPHDRGGSVRVVRGAPAAPESPTPDRPRLDPSSAHVDTSLRALPAEARSRHDRIWALERMQPRARVDTATILIVATVVFFAVVIPLTHLLKRLNLLPDEKAAPPTKPCPECLSDIPAEARRCAFCTSEVSAGTAS